MRRWCVCSKKAGSTRSGEQAKTIARPSITPSPQPDGGNCARKRKTGSELRASWRELSSHKEEKMWTKLRTWGSRLWPWAWMRRATSDFSEELESHLAMLTEENLRRGMEAAE